MWAFYVEFSLIIRLLIRLPMRQRCIREMELEQNLYQDHSGTWQIRFVGAELKVASRRGQTNRYEFPFPRDLISLSEEWLKDWRPKLASPDDSHVIMNSRGHHFTKSKEVADMVARTTYRFTGEGSPLISFVMSGRRNTWKPIPAMWAEPVGGSGTLSRWCYSTMPTSLSRTWMLGRKRSCKGRSPGKDT